MIPWPDFFYFTETRQYGNSENEKGIITDRSLHLDTGTITAIMSALDLLAFFIGYTFYAYADNIAMLLFGADDITGPYKVAVIVSIVYLIQVWSTRHFQSLPPVSGDRH